MKSHWRALSIVLAAGLCMSGCGTGGGKDLSEAVANWSGSSGTAGDSSENTAEDVQSESAEADESAESGRLEDYVNNGNGKAAWTILVYLCGSDLETDYGMASVNLEEMCEAELPEDVRVVVETGGAREWNWEGIDAEKLERIEVSDGELYLVDEQKSASMGEASTLADFVNWGVSEYPSDHYGLILWDHGGGNAEGVCYDERYDDDNLTMEELEQAMDASSCTFDLIGFDACLMASLEAAKAVDGAGKYMVASEETEPGYGWAYDTFLNALGEDPSMEGDELGEVICDSFLAKCEDYECTEQATLSVVDLSQIEKLDLAFDVYSGGMALAAGNVQLLNHVASGADKAESYGGNTEAEGYCNMVDLADLVSCTGEYLENDGTELLSVIDDAVLYEVHGENRENSNGISIFYPISVTSEELQNYTEMSDNTPYLQYVSAVTETYDSIDWDAEWEAYDSAEDSEENDGEDTNLTPLQQAIASIQGSLSSLEPVTGSDFDIDFRQFFDDDNYLNLEITSGLDAVKSVHFLLYYETDASESETASEFVYLGEDNNIDGDYDNGLFTDNFNGDWMTIGGEYVNAELIEETDHYNLYSITAEVNGEETNIRAVYNYDTEEYTVLGIYDGTYGEESGSMTSRGIRPLEDGDEVVFLLPYYNRDTEEEGWYQMDPVTWDSDVTMEDEELGDGFFLYMYEVEDIFGNEYDADPVEMQIEGDVITPYED